MSKRYPFQSGRHYDHYFGGTPYLNTVRCAITKEKDLPLTHEVVGVLGGTRWIRRVNFRGAAIAEAWIAAKQINELIITKDAIEPFDDVFRVYPIGEDPAEDAPQSIEEALHAVASEDIS